jgi:hypothetical protein
LSVHGASSGWLPSVPSWFPGGAVSWFVPARLADEVLAQARSEAAAAGPEPPRPRVRLLPPRLGLCFVLCLCLSSGLPYRLALERLCGLSAGQGPASIALTGLRRRFGARPFELLFAWVASSLAPGAAPWSYACGLLAVAWDGTTLKIPASPENACAVPKLAHGG